MFNVKYIRITAFVSVLMQDLIQTKIVHYVKKSILYCET